MLNPLPEGTQPLVPYLVIKSCDDAIDFYKKVFLAEEVMRMHGPDGKMIMHAELKLSGCMLYLADEHPKMGYKSPLTLGGSPVGMTLYCLDADKVFNRCVKAGAKVQKPMADAFWGDRMGTVIDPFGHSWTLMQRKEELSMQEIKERGKKAMAAQA
jgi:PhnB protein